MWFKDKSFKARLTTYLFWGDREFGSTESTISVKLEARDKHNREKIYRVSKGENEIEFSKIYRVRSDEGFFRNKYIVGFNEDNDALLAILVAIAVNMIRYETY